MFAFLLYAAVFIAVFMPRSPTGKAISRILTDLHARLARQVTVARVTLFVLVICAVLLLVEWGGPEAIAMMASAAPEAIAWFVTFDIATYLDVLLLAWALSALVRARAVMTTLRAGWRGLTRQILRRRARTRRARRQLARRAAARKSPDDEPGWASSQPSYPAAFA